ncbi:unnamed protein product, partial [Amoebophrya sp. A25]
ENGNVGEDVTSMRLDEADSISRMMTMSASSPEAQDSTSRGPAIMFGSSNDQHDDYSALNPTPSASSTDSRRDKQKRRPKKKPGSSTMSRKIARATKRDTVKMQKLLLNMRDSAGSGAKA